MDTVRAVILVLVPMVMCLTVHEYAHARVAFWLGDDTAARQGRLTLNPISHIDIFGTILLPVLFLWSNSGFFFGWAKPVPVNPLRFNRRFEGKRVTMSTGMMLTSAAGPLSNLLFGFVCAIISKGALMAGLTSEGMVMILVRLMVINYALAVFNLIPIPPLDGSKVLAGIVPSEIGKYLEYLEYHTFFSFILLIVLLQLGVVSKVMGPVIGWLLRVTDSLLGLGFFG